MPLSTPGGMSTFRCATARTRPEPRQPGQGSVIRTPSPPQAGQVVATWKKPARLDDLALAAAVVAGRRDRPLARARALALAAILLAIDVDRLGRAPRRLDQLDLELEEQVLPGAGAAAALAEEVAEEPAAEDVAEGRHDVFGVAEVVDPRPFQPGVAVAVVTLPLRLVGEDLVRLGRLLEPLLGLGVARVLVGMVLQRQSADRLS